jgi:argininosuccinate lyase
MTFPAKSESWTRLPSRRIEAEIMEEINASIDFDKRLASQDIRGSLAHAAMLAETGILSNAPMWRLFRTDSRPFWRGNRSGTFTFSRALEDIHMNIESRLKDLIGPVAGRLHTGRSRNDQVATDMKLWVRDTIDGLDAQLRDLQLALGGEGLDLRRRGDAGLHASAIGAARDLRPSSAGLCRDDRPRPRPLADARKRLNECPLGAAALAGTSFPIDRDMTAKALGFDRPDGEFARFRGRSRFRPGDALRRLDLRHASLALRRGDHALDDAAIRLREAVGQVHHRLLDHAAEAEPRRRRARARQVGPHLLGALQGLLVVMKGLPLTYSKDMQEDKEGTFDALQSLSLCVAAMAGMVRDMEPEISARRIRLPKPPGLHARCCPRRSCRRKSRSSLTLCCKNRAHQERSNRAL